MYVHTQVSFTDLLTRVRELTAASRALGVTAPAHQSSEEENKCSVDICSQPTRNYLDNGCGSPPIAHYPCPD